MTPTVPGPEGTRPAPTRRRPGGRTARTRTQVLDAVRAELGEHGYDGLTMDAVAARAGVHRATVYRRWGDTGGLLADVLDAAGDDDWQPPDTGSLEGDLAGLNHEIQAALTGHYRPEHLFVLQQNLELFDACQRQLSACDRAIEAHVQLLTATLKAPTTPLPAPRVNRKRADNEPHFEIRTPLHQLTGGVDLTQIDGIAPYTALKLVAELGTDMHRWATAKHFTSWLTLAPKNRISGGRLLSSRTEPSANRAAVTLRMAAMTLGRGQTALGAFYRRLAGRIGKAQAITATARKLAILVYRALKGELIYRDPGADTYDLQQRTRVLRRLRQRAATLGFDLVSRDTGEILHAAPA